MAQLFDVGTQKVPSNLLRDRFGWPPFSILNTIDWTWQRRKDEWEKVIGTSRVGRDIGRHNATPTNTFSARGEEAKAPESVSEFDPYLCELMYRWFSLPGHRILDPFAGGCVRGVVASVLNRRYVGIDISPTQVEVNQRQYKSITEKFAGIQGSAEWICGESFEVMRNGPDLPRPDMVLTCPPYYNLERYTKDPKDLSNAPSYEQFIEQYKNILWQSAFALNEDSFFVIVVSEVRADAFDIGNSQYVGLVPDTVQILRDFCGLYYYNEIILENAIGSLPIRAPKYFSRTRKIGRHHQNILIFYKGNLRSIEEKFGTAFL